MSMYYNFSILKKERFLKESLKAKISLKLQSQHKFILLLPTVIICPVSQIHFLDT